MTFEELRKANEQIKALPIGDKNYAEVHQRVKAFRMCYPEGFIKTSIEAYNENTAIIRACCGYYDNGLEVVLGMWTSFADSNNRENFDTSTGYLENAETFAVGRALGMAGFGIDTSIASFEEVDNAAKQQVAAEEVTEKAKSRSASEACKPELATPEQVAYLEPFYSGENLKKLLKTNNAENIAGLTKAKAEKLIQAIKARNQKGVNRGQ